MPVEPHLAGLLELIATDAPAVDAEDPRLSPLRALSLAGGATVRHAAAPLTS